MIFCTTSAVCTTTNVLLYGISYLRLAVTTLSPLDHQRIAWGHLSLWLCDCVTYIMWLYVSVSVSVCVVCVCDCEVICCMLCLMHITWRLRYMPSPATAAAALVIASAKYTCFSIQRILHPAATRCGIIVRLYTSHMRALTWFSTLSHVLCKEHK
jgi:hypothetical protein